MARSSNKLGNKLDNSSQYATELEYSRRSFDDATRVRNALEREAQFLRCMGGQRPLVHHIASLLETLSEASLERMGKDIRRG